MADPIAIAGKIVVAIDVIYKVYKEVKLFRVYAETLATKIRLMKPTLDFLLNMRTQRQQLNEACKLEPELDLFGSSLSEVLKYIEEVKEFIIEIKEMSKVEKVWKKDDVAQRCNRLANKLDEFKSSIMFAVLVEVKVDVEKNKEMDTIQLLVKHARRTGVLSTKSAKPVGEEKGETIHSSLINLPIYSSKDMEKVQELGRGGFGCVWLEKYHGQELAVKVFSAGNSHGYLKEVKKMQRAINCQNIVRLAGIIDEPDCQAIVMDYFPNGSLKSFMKYLNCDCWARRMRMLCDIAIGMNYLHNLTPPIVHKDIKASNIFIDHGFMAKLGDFGISTSNTIMDPRSSSELEGTVSHIPPEGWAGTAKEAKESWDIYEFGITVYEFTSGKTPWPPYANVSMIRVWLTENKRPVDMDEGEIDATTPIEVKEIMQECWQSNPDARPTSQDIQMRLTALYDGSYKSNIVMADKAITEQLAPISDKVREEKKSQSPMGMRKWHLAREFGKEDGGVEFRNANGIAVCQNGDIAVTDENFEQKSSKVNILSKDGTYKYTLKSHLTDPRSKLLHPKRVAVTSQEHLVVTDQSKHVKVFDIDGFFLHCFCTLSSEDDPSTKVSTGGVAVTQDDDIIVGDVRRRVVTIHSKPGAPRKVKVPIKPVYVATNSQQHILVSDWKERKVVSLSTEGELLFTIKEFWVDGKRGMPDGVVCDRNGDMYIAVIELNESNKPILETGHIHQYDNKGVFVRCIADGLWRPLSITMSNGSLYVANKKSVLVYSKQ